MSGQILSYSSQITSLSGQISTSNAQREKDREQDKRDYENKLKAQERKSQEEADYREHENYRENIISGLKTLISKAEWASKGADLVIKLHKTIEHVRCNSNINFCEVSCGDDSMESFTILIKERYNIMATNRNLFGEILFRQTTFLFGPKLVFSYGKLNGVSGTLGSIHLLSGLY